MAKCENENCPKEVKIGRKYCSQVCSQKGRKGYKYPVERNKKISDAQKGKKHSAERRKNISIGSKGISRNKGNQWNIGKKRSAEIKKKISERMRSEETQKKISSIMKKKWKDPEYAMKQMKAQGVCPNTQELYLNSLLQKWFPNEFKFVGDGQVFVNGKCPDFININGKKLLIELFGDYWHKGQNPEERIKLFEPYGYSTLVIWEKELKNSYKVKEKINDFMNCICK